MQKKRERESLKPKYEQRCFNIHQIKNSIKQNPHYFSKK